ncbi:predicted protein [Nematostella vectensis]|uniref:TNFR-Cys domain-containing protein n=1 Tax=Nematostella vectensis TaxID=45351 RepID=A7S6X4_NEMVE|nr:predicted protein [Nematostella vectensis]|eukprot:XP_001632565.1 predicted protein [Nematostella vectensis]
MRCKYNQIEWVKHGKIVACQACPQCTPGEESSLMCGTRIESGTLSVCRPCKEGTYSDRFDAIPCKPCTRCSTGRIILRNCTSTENAKCGKCMSGYYELPVVADCRKCVQCCHDGKDKETPGCAVVGLCMERHEGCPETTPRTPNVPSTSPEPTTRRSTSTESTSSQSTPSPASSVTQLLDVTRSKTGHDTSSVTTLPVSQTPTSDPTTQLQSGDSNTYKYVAIGSTMGLVIVVLIGFFCKMKGNWNQNIPSDVLSVQLPFLQRDTEVELNKAVDWLNGNLGSGAYENAQDACTELDKEKRGTYQYVAVGVRFLKTKTELDRHRCVTRGGARGVNHPLDRQNKD